MILKNLSATYGTKRKGEKKKTKTTKKDSKFNNQTCEGEKKKKIKREGATLTGR